MWRPVAAASARSGGSSVVRSVSTKASPVAARAPGSRSGAAAAFGESLLDVFLESCLRCGSGRGEPCGVLRDEIVRGCVEQRARSRAGGEQRAPGAAREAAGSADAGADVIEEADDGRGGGGFISRQQTATGGFGRGEGAMAAAVGPGPAGAFRRGVPAGRRADLAADQARERLAAGRELGGGARGGGVGCGADRCGDRHDDE